MEFDYIEHHNMKDCLKMNERDALHNNPCNCIKVYIYRLFPLQLYMHALQKQEDVQFIFAPMICERGHLALLVSVMLI